MPVIAYRRAWAGAFWEQGKTDMTVVLLLQGNGNQPASVQAMLLQMVLEKFAKAVLLFTGEGLDSSKEANELRKKHDAFTKLYQVLKVAEKTTQLSGGGSLQASAFLAARKLARDIAEAHPRENGSEQLEYPWEDLRGIRWPEKDLLLLESLKATQPSGKTGFDEVIDFALWMQANWQNPFV